MARETNVVHRHRHHAFTTTLLGDFAVDLASVVDPKLFFPDPDPTLPLISDPDSNPDPACL